MATSAEGKTYEVEVPGRVCLFGEHSDWAGSYRRTNSEVRPGACIVIVSWVLIWNFWSRSFCEGLRFYSFRVLPVLSVCAERDDTSRVLAQGTDQTLQASAQAAHPSFLLRICHARSSTNKGPASPRSILTS